MRRILAVVLFSLLFSASSALALPAISGINMPVAGTFQDASGGIGTFDGNFTLTRFTSEGGSLQAVGLLTGTLFDSAGNALGSVLRTVSLGITEINGTCDILHLELGPLTLDLLGLQVDLSRIVLDITAETGPGNLLGNLLCRIAGLLDPNGSLNRLVPLLNQLLRLLA